MLGFLLRRLGQALLVLIGVALVSFTMFRYVGDPVQTMLGDRATAEDRERMSALLGLDAPVPVQTLRFVGRASQGDLGLSYRSGAPVAELIRERLPATLDLVLGATLLSLLAGLTLGVWMAALPDGAARHALQAVSVVGVSLPTFLTALFLILAFAVEWPILPAFGRGHALSVGAWNTAWLTTSGLRSLVLPTLTLAAFQAALLMRIVAVEMQRVLETDFIRAARARGLPQRVVVVSHALRNALVPLITVAGVQFGNLIAFSLVTEAVFQWPGLGLLFVQAVSSADIPVMTGYLLFVALLFVAINLAVDVLYFVVEPRVRHEASQQKVAAATRPSTTSEGAHR